MGHVLFSIVPMLQDCMQQFTRNTVFNEGNSSQ